LKWDVRRGGLDVEVVGRCVEVQKGRLKGGGLDVRMVGKCMEVQKGCKRVENWTLE